MKQLLQMIDIHIIALGAVVSVVYVGLVSVITFVPGDPRLMPSLAAGVLPLLVFLEPAIITRTIDRKKMGGSAGRYFGVNTSIAVAFGVGCGLLIFGMLPRADHQTNKRQNKTSILTPDPPRVESFMTIQPSTQKPERALGQA